MNWLFAAFSMLLGFLLNSVWNSVKELQSTDLNLAKKVSEIEVLVAGNYIRKEEFDRLSTAIFTKLDRIEDKLSNKVDRA